MFSSRIIAFLEESSEY